MGEAHDDIFIGLDFVGLCRQACHRRGEMPRVRQARNGDDPSVRITPFKVDARRLLPASHPLNRMLDRTPDVIRMSELNAKLDDWLAVLEA